MPGRLASYRYGQTRPHPLGRRAGPPPAFTVSEVRVWGAIKGRALGVRFRRQVPIDAWIVDFACLPLHLVIEIDDRSHEWRMRLPEL